MSDAAPAVSVSGLRRSFGAREALCGVSFDVARGELFALLGPNGSGKTTLFRIVATLLAPSGGAASVMGRRIPGEESAAREALGIVFQAPSTDRFLTVRENLVHQGHLYGLSGARLDVRIAACAESASIADRLGDRVDTLSGGMRRRVEIAKAMLHEPGVLLLDEPTTGLDPAARRELWDQLEALRARGVAALVTTHLMEEAERCDRVAILDQGRVAAIGAPDDLRASLPGDVVTVVPRAPGRIDALAASIEDCFRHAPRKCGGALHVHADDGASLAHDILRGMEREVASVTVGRATLEDVFLSVTGRRLS